MRRWSERGLTVLLVVLVVAVMEVCSFLALSALGRRWMTYGRAAQLRREAQASRPGREEDLTEADAAQPEWISQGVAHPFVGSVLSNSFRTAIRQRIAGNEGVEYGLDLVEPGAFHPHAPDTPVVAITGGSFAGQIAWGGSRRLRAGLLAGLGSAFKRIIVVNLSIPGYKQPQQLMMLNYMLALGAHFDAVINIDGFNDIALGPTENQPKGVAAFYPRTWYYHARNFDPETRLVIAELAGLTDRRAAWARRFSVAPLRFSMTATVVWVLLDRRLALAVAAKKTELARRTDSGATYTVTGPPRHYRTLGEINQELADIWRRSSLQMHRLAKGSGILYYHFLQPNQYVPGSKPMGAQEQRQALDLFHPYRTVVVDGYPRLIAGGQQLAQEGVRFYDLTRIFASVPEPRYIDTCCHVNPAGSEQVAAAVVEAILRDVRGPRRGEPAARPPAR
jgi:hypothetical protein